MATTIVNLTLLKVTDELNNFRKTYPEYYQMLGHNQDLSQELIGYILNRIPNRFFAMCEDENSLIAKKSFMATTQEKNQIEALIIKGIMRLNSGYISAQLQQIYGEKNDSNLYTPVDYG